MNIPNCILLYISFSLIGTMKVSCFDSISNRN